MGSRQVARVGVLAAVVTLVVSAQAGVGVWKRAHLANDCGCEPGVTQLAVDPSNRQTVYATTDEEAFYKSTNGGHRWRILMHVEGDAVALDPTHPRTVYYGGNPGGGNVEISKSRDGGRTWKTYSKGLGLGSIDVIAVDPQYTQTVYVGVEPNFDIPPVSQGGVFKSADGGQTWKLANQGFPKSTAVRSLAIDPKHPENLYAVAFSGVDENGDSTSNGAFKSTNGGETWQSLPLTADQVNVLAVDPYDSAIVYAGSSQGVFKSTDAGSHWSPSGLQIRDVHALTFDPRRRGTLYAGTWDEGVFSSQNSGRSWQAANNGLYERITALDLAASGLYAGTPDGFFTAPTTR
jgi:photosystem II stability/assembly factor-like uncharacterized protein